jgi:hypothetical protein
MQVAAVVYIIQRDREREISIERQRERGNNYLNNSTASYCEKLHSLGELQLLLKTGDGFFGKGLHGKQTGAGF